MSINEAIKEKNNLNLDKASYTSQNHGRKEGFTFMFHVYHLYKPFDDL